MVVRFLPAIIYSDHETWHQLGRIWIYDPDTYVFSLTISTAPSCLTSFLLLITVLVSSST